MYLEHKAKRIIREVSHPETTIALMRNTEWAQYLKDAYDVDHNAGPIYDYIYEDMVKALRQSWGAFSREQRLAILETCTESQVETIRDNEAKLADKSVRLERAGEVLAEIVADAKRSDKCKRDAVQLGAFIKCFAREYLEGE